MCPLVNYNFLFPLWIHQYSITSALIPISSSAYLWWVDGGTTATDGATDKGGWLAGHVHLHQHAHSNRHKSRDAVALFANLSVEWATKDIVWNISSIWLHFFLWINLSQVFGSKWWTDVSSATPPCQSPEESHRPLPFDGIIPFDDVELKRKECAWEHHQEKFRMPSRKRKNRSSQLTRWFFWSSSSVSFHPPTN